MHHIRKVQPIRKELLLALFGAALLTTSSGFAAEMHKSKPFKGVKANTGSVTHSKEGNKQILTLSDDFKMPDAPDVHWRVVDSKGSVYELQRLAIKGDKMNRKITLPAYIRDVAKVQMWCAFAETNLGEAEFEKPVTMSGANALKIAQASAAMAQSIIYIDSKKVAAAFSKGAVLVGEEEHMMHASRNYMVHASRRDGPGVGEVHTRDTDIIYVLEGTATFVTGGSLVDGKTIAPDEIRGPSIRGGESRRITKGDVIIVPEGVPHWFQQVQAPFKYYVVKVR
jgi:mannose-6-phosphate isomerase-like protein (cupin superfamily)